MQLRDVRASRQQPADLQGFGDALRRGEVDADRLAGKANRDNARRCRQAGALVRISIHRIAVVTCWARAALRLVAVPLGPRLTRAIPARQAAVP